MWAFWPSGTTWLPEDWWAPGASLAPRTLAGGVRLFERLAESSALPAGADSHLAPYVYSWGDPRQLGTGEQGVAVSAPAPLRPLQELPVAALAASSSLAAAVTPAGAVYAWGTATGSDVPRLVVPAVGCTAVAAGERHLLALTEDGSVVSWGDNARGQLGRDTAVSEGGASIATAQPGLVSFGADVQEGVRVVAVAAGRAHSLALLEDGSLFGWGDNSARQLGLARCAHGQTPPPDSLALTANASCAFWDAWDPTLMLAAPTRIQAAAVSVASKGITLQLRPVRMRAVFASGDASFAVAVGDGDVAAGQLYAWGRGAGGVLGLAGTGAEGSGDAVPLPMPVAALQGVDVRCVAASAGHAMAAAAGGVTYAWGSNWYGQLGVGADALPAWLPRRVHALDGVDVVALAAGARHSLALSDAGEVFGWGDNSFGQLGVGQPPDGNATLLGRTGWQSTPSNFSAPELALARRRRALLRSTTDLLTALQPAAAFAALTGAVAVNPGGWLGSLPSTSDGGGSRYLPFPGLLMGIQQVAAIAAAGHGSWAARALCAPGSQLVSGACKLCANGTASSELSPAACTPCPPGQFAGTRGARACRLCAAGSYSDSSGASSCAACSAGTFLPFPSGTSQDQCLDCPQGSFSAVTGAAACVRCPAGKYSATARATTCSSCPAGTFQPRTGATSRSQCLECPRCAARAQAEHEHAHPHNSSHAPSRLLVPLQRHLFSRPGLRRLLPVPRGHSQLAGGRGQLPRLPSRALRRHPRPPCLHRMPARHAPARPGRRGRLKLHRLPARQLRGAGWLWRLHTLPSGHVWRRRHAVRPLPGRLVRQRLWRAHSRAGVPALPPRPRSPQRGHGARPWLV